MRVHVVVKEGGDGPDPVFSHLPGLAQGGCFHGTGAIPPDRQELVIDVMLEVTKGTWLGSY